MAIIPTLAMLMLVAGCIGLEPGEATPPDLSLLQEPGPIVSYQLPTADGDWTPTGSHAADPPTEAGSLNIEGIDNFSFEPGEVATVRPDIFRPGFFSLFDIMVHLDERGKIELEYHFDAAMDTHIIDAIDGEPHWWYQARYSGGWYESNVFRMDMYPYKDGTKTRVYHRSEEYLADVCRTFGEEVQRQWGNGGEVIIPKVTIQAPRERLEFSDVRVTAHDVRSDVLQPGVITALDIILSLAEQGELSRLKLTWYESIGSADPVESYWLEQVNDAEARGTCGFVYETGPEEFSGFSGSHIHIPSDVRVIISPEYALWFWICL